MTFEYKCSKYSTQAFFSFMRVEKVIYSLIKFISGVPEGFMDGCVF